MSLNAATIEVLLAKGLTGDDLLEVARAMEAKTDRTNADRQARYRAKRKKEESADSNALRNGVTPPNEYISNPPVPISNEIGADPEKVMFDSGVEILTAAGSPPTKARSLLGKWKRDYGAPDVISALSAAKREGAIEPVAFIEAALRTRAKQQAPPEGAWAGA